MKRFAYLNTTVTIQDKSKLQVDARGRVYQIVPRIGNQVLLNSIWLPGLGRLAVELMSGRVIHLVRRKDSIVCLEDAQAERTPA